MMSEYGNNNAQSAKEEKGTRHLVDLFTSAVTPKLGQMIFKTEAAPEFTFKQTPELRSSLTKTIRFRAKQSTYEIANKIKDAALAQKGRDGPSKPVKFIYSA